MHFILPCVALLTLLAACTQDAAFLVKTGESGGYTYEYVSNDPHRKFNVVLVGDQAQLNLNELQKYGTVQELSADELFGFDLPALSARQQR